MPYLKFAPLFALSSSNGSCSDGVQWIWKIMGDCAVTERQQISVYVGLLSMATWIMVGIPQIIKNFRNIDGMCGVSFLLLFQWAAGDTTNLIGAILTNQLKPQIYLAIFFVMSDSVLLLQYLFFHIRIMKRKRDNDRAITAVSRAVLCVMGVASLGHCLTGFLTPSSLSLNAALNKQVLSIGRRSRFLLSSQGDNSLLFGSEYTPATWIGSSQNASTAFWHDSKDIIGYVIGCVSSVFYLGSRLSQIHKNYKAKNTEGLAILTFILAVVGNVAYGGQILIVDLSGQFLLQHTPWLIGSLGVIGLDCTLLWQFHHYSHMTRQRDETRQSLLNHEDCVINTDHSTDAQISRDKDFQDSLY